MFCHNNSAAYTYKESFTLYSMPQMGREKQNGSRVPKDSAVTAIDYLWMHDISMLFHVLLISPTCIFYLNSVSNLIRQRR